VSSVGAADAVRAPTMSNIAVATIIGMRIVSSCGFDQAPQRAVH
jgi:hypothetical protein